MATLETSSPDTSREVAVTVVDCDVHPTPQAGVTMAEFVPEPWRSRLSRQGHEMPAFAVTYDPPDFEHAFGQRADAFPPGGFPCSDPQFAFEQLIAGAGVDLAILQPFAADQFVNPEVEHAFQVAQNNWLAEVWLDHNNDHGRWRGSISVTHREPEEGAREIERWAGHPYMSQVLMSPQSRGVQFGDRRLDPIYEAASRHGLPVATHLSSPQIYELSPIYPVGAATHWADWLSSFPLVYASHMMSLVFDGTFERHPDLQFIFVEGAFAWLLPTLWRMDAVWQQRRADLPWLKRPPSEVVRDHIWLTTQPMEEVDPVEFRQFVEWLEPSPADYLLFSTDYPHWTYDDPEWVRKRVPAEARDRIMFQNAIDLFRLPSVVPALQ
jgi:predicted TIM-barrel fold metal-dependent hydrolase